MNVDLSLLERWLTGWSLARGVPLPRHHGGGLAVDVGWPEQWRRHVFADAGEALQECASRIHEPFVYLKAPVDPDHMRRALPARWTIEAPHYLMYRSTPISASAAPPAGYTARMEEENGASLIRLLDAAGQTAAIGRVALNHGTAVFDRIETVESHRRKGLARALMIALDAVAEQAATTERLLVATEAGRALYLSLGWRVLAPYSTAVLPAPSL